MRTIVAQTPVRLPRSLKSLSTTSSFWKNLAVVAGGTAAGQAFTIAASPVLSRLYGPEDFGLLSVYASVVSIVAVVSTLTYHHAIPAPEQDEEAANLTVLSLALVLVASLLSGGVVAIFRDRFERNFEIPGFARYVIAVPLGVLGLSTYEVVSQWAARKKAFGILAKTSAQRSVLQTSIQLASGFAHLGKVGLVLGQLMGQWGGTLQVARKSWRVDHMAFRGITWSTLAATARRFRRFPFFTLPGVVLYAIDVNATPLLFAHFFGPAVTGHFALGNRLVLVPFMLIGNAAQKVFYPAAAAAKQQGKLAEETAETYLQLLRLVLPIVFVMTACAPELFSVLMGARWREAGVYMQWLALRACFTMVVFPLTPLIYVLERQAAGSIFSGLQLSARVGAVIVGSHYGDPLLAVGLLGVGTGLLWLGYLFYLLAISGNRVSVAVKQLVVEALVAGAISTPIWGVKLLHGSDLVVTATAMASGLVALAAILNRSRLRLRSRTGAA